MNSPTHDGPLPRLAIVVPALVSLVVGAYFINREPAKRHDLTRLEWEYAPVFERLHLTWRESAAVRQLIALRQPLESPAASPATRRAPDVDAPPAPRRLDLTRAYLKSRYELETLLGPDRYAAFRALEKTIPDRNLIEVLEWGLPTGPALSSGQKAALENALAHLFGPGHERVILDHRTTASDRIVRAVAPILSPGQLSLLASVSRDDQAELASLKSLSK